MIGATVNKVRYSVLSITPLASYDIPFRYWSADEIDVLIVNSEGGVSTISASNFTVTAPGETGTLSFDEMYSFPAGTESMTIVRVIDILQQSDYRNGDVLDADMLEQSLDKLTAILQQVDESIQRVVMIPVTDPASDLVIPSVEVRKNMLLGFDADGNIVPVLTTDIEQKLADALAAEENAITQANNAASSASAAATSESNAATSENNAGTSEANALASENKAGKWADENENVEVETGKYSAKHHAQKAEASKSAAAASENAAALSETNAGNSEAAAAASEAAAALSETNSGNSEAAAAASKSAAALSESNAGNSEDKAGKWAEELVDVEVETGKYSAKHHATKAAESEAAAEASKNAAALSEGNAGNSEAAAALSETNAGNSESAAALSETNAAASESKAGKWAEETEDVEVELGKYSAKHHASKAMLADAAANKQITIDGVLYQYALIVKEDNIGLSFTEVV
jgi:hypothetical protein